ncbi:hypothetical protein EVAR_57679_1 [Eumeta japonica]|uniref:Uncharacterized protein n=1 Tax=Eumeta variegata TaxID=151549 RepID=A0A4C1YLI0_EUMVA|nr:hypothetical protein EVAR_57679_1 [Eumeta japonica]
MAPDSNSGMDRDEIIFDREIARYKVACSNPSCLQFRPQSAALGYVPISLHRFNYESGSASVVEAVSFSFRITVSLSVVIRPWQCLDLDTFGFESDSVFRFDLGPAFGFHVATATSVKTVSQRANISIRY